MVYTAKFLPLGITCREDKVESLLINLVPSSAGARILKHVMFIPPAIGGRVRFTVDRNGGELTLETAGTWMISELSPPTSLM